ncbi:MULTISPECIES: nucleotide pyrophosphohydrolase [Leptospira]|uniref:Pyrophosphatase n=4 Tax=Leptospira TaxID=171 RepID=A0A2P2D7G3_9LEPT|nr:MULTISPECIES: nucleotide pyrophosphohydrolase [Leptospira]EIE01086.1 phosphoribosyl-ATP diphosphatase [Leptospira licerasiae serovar Varillal str. VAR 010]EJZ43839.1 phosphoribosyl-ATP diphosphatase [Leptospira licerasiae str. MMD4847]TGK41315.1 pyrophosphatase [Leptospira andrefontaineae]TGM88926.1 pyrophosphatase [Leptospira licerasiae]TGN00102.1 pyrophosphatase [Leptospira dzoumogneensis]
MNFDEAQKTVDDWIKTIGVKYFSELTNLAILMEEVGEFSRLVARKYGDQSFKKGEDPEGLSKELGDILFVLTCLANQMGISMEEAFKATLEKNTTRDKDRHKNNPKLKDL